MTRASSVSTTTDAARMHNGGGALWRLFGNVRPGEGTTVALMGANLFLLLVGYYVVKVVREPLILATGGAELKSYAAAAQAVSLMLFVPAYGWLASRMPRVRLITWFVVFFVVCLELFAAGLQLGVPHLGFIFYVWVGMFSLATVAQFWSFATDIYSHEAGERLFPIIAVGANVGSPVGARIGGLLFDHGVTVGGMLQVTVAVLLVHLGLYHWLDRRAAVHAHDRTPTEPIQGRDGFRLVLASPYLRWFALLIVLLNVVNTLGEYIISRSVVAQAVQAAATHPGLTTSAFIGDFYADYFFWVNVAAILLQAFVASRLVKRFGLPGALLALPVVALGAYTLIGVGAAFALVRWAKTAENATDYSVMNTARQLVWLPTSREEKYKAKQAIDTFFMRCGDVVAAAVVFFATARVGLGVRGFAGVNVFLVIVWLAVALRVLSFHKSLSMRPRVFRAAAAAVIAVSVAAPAGADEPLGGETRRVVVGPQFGRNGFHRWLWGADYRDLYTAPVELPVLDLKTVGGGLTPTRVIGHGETKALALKGANGRNYTFRPVIKDPTGLLPQDLRETLARRILVDQMAAQHPAGHVVAPGLLQTAGVLHNTPRLVVMPSDGALGEIGKPFANLVGDLEEWGGSPGFGGTIATIDGEEMWKRLRESPATRIDSRAYLKARLIDQMLGDWDRHRDQWRWGQLPGKDLWQPIPEDRDQAFARFEGTFNFFLRPQLPLLVHFGTGYASVPGLTFDGWDVDKRVLSDLDWPVWQGVVSELQREITNDAIQQSARLMPAEYFRIDGPRLIAGLEARRDRLPAQARRFYDYINHDVDVFCTRAPEYVEAARQPNGDVDVRVFVRGDDGRINGKPPYFHRRFEASVTSEVRLYLEGGDDKVVVTGGHHEGVLLRVVAGGRAVLDDSQGGGTRFSASDDDDELVPGPGTEWNRRPYTAPPGKGAKWIPPRDFGRVSGPLFIASYGSDYGALVGFALNTTGYGFRKDPWSDKQSLRLLYSTKQRTVRGTYLGEFRFENSPLRLGVGALGSGMEFVSFYGLGNETPRNEDTSAYKIEQDRFELRPELIYEVSKDADLALGLVARYNQSEPRRNPVLGAQAFYGQGHFSQAGVSGRFRFDTTDHHALPYSGVAINGAGTLFPSLSDVKSTYGEVHGEARLCATPVSSVTVVLRGGGERVFGAHPFFDSAFLGGKGLADPLGTDAGASAVRGLPAQRYAGDGSVYGGADIFLPMKQVFLFVPGTVGLVGYYDVGRVFLSGESSSLWHHGAGGGLFFLTPGRRNLMSFTVSRSESRTAYYVRAGFGF